MKIIAAADRNFAIGCDNKLLAKLPHDMKRFKVLTAKNICVMGKNTYLSIPVRPLPDRTTLLLTSTPSEFPEVSCFSDITSLLCCVKELEARGDEVFVCGGEQVYRTLMPYCESALITRISYAFEADTYLPNFDKLHGWKKVNETEVIETNGYFIKFVDYVNIEKQPF